MGYTIKLMYPPVIKHGLLGNPKLHGEWENHETRWWILHQTMFEYWRAIRVVYWVQICQSSDMGSFGVFKHVHARICAFGVFKDVQMHILDGSNTCKLS